MLDLFKVEVAVYGSATQTLLIKDSNAASARETARFHYNSNLDNRVISCTMIACGWEPDRHHSFLD